MPELPEVETVVRTLRPHVLGKTVLEFLEARKPCFVPESLKPGEALGLKVLDLFRRGKFVVCRLGDEAAAVTDFRDFRSFSQGACGLEGPSSGLDGDSSDGNSSDGNSSDGDSSRGELFWVTHLRMTGTLMAYEGADREKEAARIGRHTRFRALLGRSTGPAGADSGLRGNAVALDARASVDQDSCDQDAGAQGTGAQAADVTAVIFNDQRTFGRMFLGERQRLLSWSSWAKLGPEPLDMGEEAFVAALRGRRAIKSVLMDQSVVAGIGNIYADESLFAAGIWPGTPADRLAGTARARLYRELVRLLELSIKECGSSIRDYHDANGNVGAFQNHFQVYGRGGEKCLVCGRTLRKTVLGGRGTVHCPGCQRKRA